MENYLSFLRSRRSCRNFDTKAVSRADLEQITDVACHAPSARNRQLWQFTVVQDSAVLAQLAAAVGSELQREEYGFYGAPVLILCSNEREHPYGKEDCACAMENIYLAAHALGLGAVWINQLTAVCDRASVRKILDRLDVPESHIVYGCAAIGHPLGAPSEKEVKHPVVWH